MGACDWDADAAYIVAGNIYIYIYIYIYTIFCRRRQYIMPGFTAHIVVHRHILSPLTIYVREGGGVCWGGGGGQTQYNSLTVGYDKVFFNFILR